MEPAPPREIWLLIVEDHPTIWSRIRRLLQSASDIEVVEAGEGTPVSEHAALWMQKFEAGSYLTDP